MQREEICFHSLSYVFVGVDEVTIINILTNRSNEQRQDIAFAYQRRTKKVAKYAEISYLIFFLWVVRFSGLVHLTINCEQMRSYYWAYCFTGSKDAFTLSESVEDFLAVAEITMVTYEPASHQACEWKANLRECLFEGRSGEAWKHSYLFVYCMATLHKENILFTWVVWMRKDCSQLCWSSIDMKQSDILSWTCQKYMHSSVDGKRSLKCLQQSA